ncbi:MAG: hypothetical protein PHC95_12590 [Parabacteroides sp.]|nr:hypothetical protein [Parabacteroides sp.]
MKKVLFALLVLMLSANTSLEADVRGPNPYYWEGPEGDYVKVTVVSPSWNQTGSISLKDVTTGVSYQINSGFMYDQPWNYYFTPGTYEVTRIDDNCIVTLNGFSATIGSTVVFSGTGGNIQITKQ